MMRLACSAALPSQDGAGAAGFDGDAAMAMDSSVNHLLDDQSSSISENTAPSIRISDFLDGNTCTARLRLVTYNLLRTFTAA